jgi:acyl-CoA dehydrogenase
VLIEELGRRGLEGWDVTLHNAIVAPYLEAYGSQALKQRWLPAMASGAAIGAIAMTEPGAGSDLQGIRATARREGDSYIVNGAKTFITNGQNADVVLVVARTDPAAGARGISILVVDARARRVSRAGAISTRSAVRRPTPPNCSSRICVFPSTACWARRRGAAFTS